ncbi:hypothetical protein SOVF_102120 [Spinacia oleracea]|nr:hypothetical protein SOVF_102120 [Spinacia oleracea]
MAYPRAIFCFCLLFLIFNSSIISAEHTGRKDETVVEIVRPICRRCPPRKTPPSSPPPLEKDAHVDLTEGRGGYNGCARGRCR